MLLIFLLLRVILRRHYRDCSPKQAAVVHLCRFLLVWKTNYFPSLHEMESGVNFPLWYPCSFSFFSDWKWYFWIKWQPRCGSNEHLKYFVCLSWVLSCAEQIPLVLYQHYFRNFMLACLIVGQRVPNECIWLKLSLSNYTCLNLSAVAARKMIGHIVFSSVLPNDLHFTYDLCVSQLPTTYPSNHPSSIHP